MFNNYAAWTRETTGSKYLKPSLTASVVLGAADLFAHAVAAVPVESGYRARVDIAKLGTYFALLYLWEETREFAAAEGRIWPVEANASDAFAEVERVFGGIPMPPPARDIDTRNLNEDGNFSFHGHSIMHCKPCT